MKWLTLSSEKFEPISDIQFSFKKPLFAASVILRFTQSHGHGVAGKIHAFASLKARIPLKGPLEYEIEALSSNAERLFGFSFIRENDVSGESSRETHVRGETVEIDGVKVDVINDSPAPILAHVLTLPAFAQSHLKDEGLYGAHLMVGRRIQALRLERKRPAAHGSAPTSRPSSLETYEGKLIKVPRALDEKSFNTLPWANRKGFEFDWDVDTKRIVAARFTVPIFGTIEIKR